MPVNAAVLNLMDVIDLFYSSYLYPDGRSINPDLSWAVQATPEDHVKVDIERHTDR